MDTPRGPILAKMFDEMDANGDGQIDEKEGVTIGRHADGSREGGEAEGQGKSGKEEMKPSIDERHG